MNDSYKINLMRNDIDDTKESLFHNNTAIGFATAQRYGIGINIGRIRAKGTGINNNTDDNTSTNTDTDNINNSYTNTNNDNFAHPFART
mgnify:CR=1 FL=1